jgi:transcriptional regulator with XRE-family HTH domain
MDPSALRILHPQTIADPMLTGRQLKAARAFLGWSRQELSEASDVPAITIEKFEGGADSKQSTIIKLRRACEKRGHRVSGRYGNRGRGIARGTRECPAKDGEASKGQFLCQGQVIGAT